MNKKLTLLLDGSVISQAKEYAQNHRETLSGMVEKYFKYLTAKTSKKQRIKIPKDIEALVGIIKIPDYIDVKKDYRRYRADKDFHE